MEIGFADGTKEHYEDVPFSRGAQGEVYLSLDRLHVVKLYAPHECTPQREQQLRAITTRYNVVNGDPYWEELFAWPEKVAVSPRLGVRSRYISGRLSLDHYFFSSSFRRMSLDQRGNWLGRVAVAIKIARAVGRVSNNGLCLSDLSERNTLVDPLKGDVTLVDCESLVLPGALPAVVLGTHEYMAPELVSGREREPSVRTDRHALAVLLYRWLLNRHPLLGPKRHSDDPEIDDRLALGEEALYVEHPADSSNKPPQMSVTTDALTPRLRDLFRVVFVEGLRQPDVRPSASQWEEALIELFDRIIPCPNASCSQGYFTAPDVGPISCPWCRAKLEYPHTVLYLRLLTPRSQGISVSYQPESRYDHLIVAWPGRCMYLWHADPSIAPTPGSVGRPPDATPRARIEYDNIGERWVLRNMGFAPLMTKSLVEGGIADDWVIWSATEQVPLHGTAQVLLGTWGKARLVEVHPHSTQ